MANMAGGVDGGGAEPAEVIVGDVGGIPFVAVVVSVRFRFQQSGKIFFCSSASSLARWEYCSRSSGGKDFQASPKRTLIALKKKMNYKF